MCKKVKKYLPETHPHLIEEWDWDKNELKPEEVTYGSNRKVHWKCQKNICCYEWTARISSRTRGARPNGCPACANKVVTTANRFSTACPEKIKAEWGKLKNIDICMESITAWTQKKVWWLCDACSYSWRASIRPRVVYDVGCPACANMVVTDKNNLKFLFPEIAGEVDIKKNGFGPESITYGSEKFVWWKCKEEECRHSWRASVCNRTSKKRRGCPACAGYVPTPRNSLFYRCPDLVKEWDKELNGCVTPEKVVFSSGLAVWWRCEICEHGWRAQIHSRTFNSMGCPKCARGRRSSKASNKWLDGLGVIFKNREVRLRGLGGVRGLVVDGFDSKTNTVYEFLGDYWHGNPNNKRFNFDEINKHNKKSFGKLYEETVNRLRLLEKAGYNVVYIWEKDFKEGKMESSDLND